MSNAYRFEAMKRWYSYLHTYHKDELLVPGGRKKLRDFFEWDESDPTHMIGLKEPATLTKEPIRKQSWFSRFKEKVTRKVPLSTKRKVEWYAKNYLAYQKQELSFSPEERGLIRQEVHNAKNPYAILQQRPKYIWDQKFSAPKGKIFELTSVMKDNSVDPEFIKRCHAQLSLMYKNHRTEIENTFKDYNVSGFGTRESIDCPPFRTRTLIKYDLSSQKQSRKRLFTEWLDKTMVIEGDNVHPVVLSKTKTTILNTVFQEWEGDMERYTFDTIGVKESASYFHLLTGPIRRHFFSHIPAKIEVKKDTNFSAIAMDIRHRVGFTHPKFTDKRNKQILANGLALFWEVVMDSVQKFSDALDHGIDFHKEITPQMREEYQAFIDSPSTFKKVALLLFHPDKNPGIKRDMELYAEGEVNRTLTVYRELLERQIGRLEAFDSKQRNVHFSLGVDQHLKYGVLVQNCEQERKSFRAHRPSWKDYLKRSTSPSPGYAK